MSADSNPKRPCAAGNLATQDQMWVEIGGCMAADLPLPNRVSSVVISCQCRMWRHSLHSGGCERLRTPHALASSVTSGGHASFVMCR